MPIEKPFRPITDLPSFCEDGHCDDPNYFADRDAVYAEAQVWRRQHKFVPVAADSFKIGVLAIDQQVDFTFLPPHGSLPVTGRTPDVSATAAQRRYRKWMYTHMPILHFVYNTADSHLPFQVFTPSMHLKKDDEPCTAHTIITHDEYAAGDYKPNPHICRDLGVDPHYLQQYFTYYTKQLTIPHPVTGFTKHALYLWPFHCDMGSNGWRLTGVAEEVRLFHSWARNSMNTLQIKGGSPFTEHYSIFSPEVMKFHDGSAIPGVQRNVLLIQALMRGDIIVIVGLADSHCVKESIADLLGWIMQHDPKLVSKVYIMADCMASVVVPGGMDFTDDAQKALGDFRDRGMNVVTSDMPIETWPGMPKVSMQVAV